MAEAQAEWALLTIAIYHNEEKSRYISEGQRDIMTKAQGGRLSS